MNLHLKRRSSGQTMLFIVCVLAILMLMALWLFDFNNAAVSRVRAQNAADSSAIAAAQWQAKSLNSIGELNLIKAINTLLTDTPPGGEVLSGLIGDPSYDYNIIQACLDGLQARLTFIGPMLAMVASQQAAKNGGIENYDEFTNGMREHAVMAETFYPSVYTAADWSAPAWTGMAWGASDWNQRYARMLHFMADDGMATMPDNASYYWWGNLNAGPMATAYLLSKSFYYAIAVKDWCYLQPLLIGPSPYNGWSYWGAVTVTPKATYGSEYLNLGVHLSGAGSMTNPTVENYFNNQLLAKGLQITTNWPPPIRWATYIPGSYGPGEWGQWALMQNIVDSGSVVADVRPYYHFAGADAKMSVAIPFDDPFMGMSDRSGDWTGWLVDDGAKAQFKGSVDRFGADGSVPSGSGEDIPTPFSAIWATSSAKPFGRIPGIDQPVYTFEVVLPVFTDVRLVPNRAVTSTGSRDWQWLRHIILHVPPYSTSGTAALPNDEFYDRMLVRWEDPAFRQEGADWLNLLDPVTGLPVHDCTPPPRITRSGGPGGGGGGVGGF